MGPNASSQGKWTERFGISSNDLIGLPENLAAHPDVEALRWCLMNGKISEAEYLEWAMQNFEMPAVTGDFFTAPSDPRFWEAVKELHPWNPGFFPLAEWEGVYLIACLEPPKNFKFPYPYRFVLASARHLLLLWDHLNPPSIAETAEEASSQPAPLNMNVPVNESGGDTFDMPDGIVMNGSFGRSAASEETVTHPHFGGDDVPVGLDVDPSKVAPRPKVPDGFVAASDEMIPPLSHQPDGLMMDIEATEIGAVPADEAKTVVVPRPAQPTATSSPTPPPRPGPAMRVAPPVPPRPVVPPPPPPVTAPAPVAPRTPPPAVQSAPVQAAPTPEPAPPPAAQAEFASAESSGGTVTNFTISNSSPRPLSSAQNMAALGVLALAHLHQQFDIGMILLFDEATQTLKPWKWSDLLSGTANASMTSVDLNQPSAFRIVFRSKQPFHGQVYTSPVNQAFAAAFTGGRLPAQMTVVPVMDGKQWQGMLVGILNKPKNFRQVLPPFQDLGDEVAKQLARLGKAGAAA